MAAAAGAVTVTPPDVGFVVLYRWRLQAGQEPAFIAAWSQATAALLERGSLGSRLHLGPDGLWYGYAQWPSEAARARAFEAWPDGSDAWERMQQAVAESLPELRLSPVADYLVLPPLRPGASN